MKKLLITGFDPFDGATINPSWEAVKLLPDTIGEYEIHKLQIPTVFGLAPRTVLAEAENIQPDVIISVGQAGTRPAVTPERIGINVRDARICDNAGISPKDEPIIPNGPDGYFSTLPVKAMIAAINESGLPAAISNTAGTFVCNDVLYSLLHHYAGTGIRCGFIHVPWLPELGEPSLPLESTEKALEIAISVL